MSNLISLVAQRLALGLVTLFLVSIIIAVGAELLPGSLADRILGQGATPDTVAAMERELGLDQPVHIRYAKWLNGVLHGDFGKSLANQRDVSELIAPRLLNTMLLALTTASIAVPIAVVLGILAALYRNGLYDRVVNVVTLSSISTPEFFIAYILVLIFAVNAPIFPPISNVDIGMPFWSRVHAMFLPAATLSLVVIAHMMRMTRASLINLLASPYVEMAKLKGLSQWRIMFKHVLPNAWGPIINVIVLNIAHLIVGVTIVEVVFVYSGLGRLMVDAVRTEDVPVVQACSLIFASTYILLNLAADLLSIVTNPRLLHPK